MFGVEPAAWVAVLRSVLLVAIVFGAAITDAQLAAIIVAAEAIGAVLIRVQVRPVVKEPTGQHLGGDGRGLT